MKSILIGIAGGTGSGKSTFTNRLKDAFHDDIAVLYHDNYYKKQDGIPFEERKKMNYDHPEAFETELLLDQLSRLRGGKSIECPVYDYSQHNLSDQFLTKKKKRVILVEGILVFAKERGRDIEGVVEQYLTTVKPMHYLYVEPTKPLADIIINSGMNEVAFQLVKTSIEKILGEPSDQ